MCGDTHSFSEGAEYSRHLSDSLFSHCLLFIYMYAYVRSYIHSFLVRTNIRSSHRWNRYRRPAVPVRSGPVRYRSGFRTGRSTVRPVIRRSTGLMPFDRSFTVRPVFAVRPVIRRSTGHLPFDRSFITEKCIK